MTEKGKKLFHVHFLFAFLLAAVTLLLVGAGRLGDSMVTRQAEQERMQNQWRYAVDHLLLSRFGTDLESKELRKLAAGHPELFLQAFHNNLQPVQDH